MLVDQTKINNDIFFGNFIDGTVDGETYSPMPLVSDVITGADDFISSRFALEDCYPNPAKDKTTMRFRTNISSEVSITLFDNLGKERKVLVKKIYDPGEHNVEVDLKDLPAGNYIYQMKTGFYKNSRKLSVIK
jgi:hypothetical protein